jgi:hypothetical protein
MLPRVMVVSGHTPAQKSDVDNSGKEPLLKLLFHPSHVAYVLQSHHDRTAKRRSTAHAGARIMASMAHTSEGMERSWGGSVRELLVDARCETA